MEENANFGGKFVKKDQKWGKKSAQDTLLDSIQRNGQSTCRIVSGGKEESISLGLRYNN